MMSDDDRLIQVMQVNLLEKYRTDGRGFHFNFTFFCNLSTFSSEMNDWLQANWQQFPPKQWEQWLYTSLMGNAKVEYYIRIQCYCLQ